MLKSSKNEIRNHIYKKFGLDFSVFLFELLRLFLIITYYSYFCCCTVIILNEMYTNKKSQYRNETTNLKKQKTN